MTPDPNDHSLPALLAEVRARHLSVNPGDRSLRYYNECELLVALANAVETDARADAAPAPDEARDLRILRGVVESTTPRDEPLEPAVEASLVRSAMRAWETPAVGEALRELEEALRGMSACVSLADGTAPSKGPAEALAIVADYAEDACQSIEAAIAALRSNAVRAPGNGGKVPEAARKAAQEIVDSIDEIGDVRAAHLVDADLIALVARHVLASNEAGGVRVEGVVVQVNDHRAPIADGMECSVLVACRSAVGLVAGDRVEVRAVPGTATDKAEE